MLRNKFKKMFRTGYYAQSLTDFDDIVHDDFEPPIYKQTLKLVESEDWGRLNLIYSGLINGKNKQKRSRMLNSIDLFFKSNFNITLTEEQIHAIYKARLKFIGKTEEEMVEQHG